MGARSNQEIFHPNRDWIFDHLDSSFLEHLQPYVFTHRLVPDNHRTLVLSFSSLVLPTPSCPPPSVSPGRTDIGSVATVCCSSPSNLEAPDPPFVGQCSESEGDGLSHIHFSPRPLGTVRILTTSPSPPQDDPPDLSTMSLEPPTASSHSPSAFGLHLRQPGSVRRRPPFGERMAAMGFAPTAVSNIATPPVPVPLPPVTPPRRRPPLAERMAALGYGAIDFPSIPIPSRPDPIAGLIPPPSLIPPPRRPPLAERMAAMGYGPLEVPPLPVPSCPAPPDIPIPRTRRPPFGERMAAMGYQLPPVEAPIRPFPTPSPPHAASFQVIEGMVPPPHHSASPSGSHRQNLPPKYRMMPASPPRSFKRKVPEEWDEALEVTISRILILSCF